MNVPDTLSQPTSGQDPTQSDDGNAAAWIDSDDERIIVSLSSNPRMRKLRTAEFEDLINGKEYSKRLRRQFERLYPVPGWANPSAARKVASKQQRRWSTASESSEANNSADDLPVPVSTLPLAKLLQNTNRLTQLTATSSSACKKLRPEVIDIHRTKDVGTAQPVSQVLSFPTLTVIANLSPAVRCNKPRISPHSSSPPVFRTLFYSLPPPYVSTFFKLKPTAHNSAPGFHSSHNFPFLPASWQ